MSPTARELWDALVQSAPQLQGPENHMGNMVNSHSILGAVTFKKSGHDLAKMIEAKCVLLSRMIEERKARVRKLREENGIDDTVLAELYRLAAKGAVRNGAYAVSFSMRVSSKVGGAHVEPDSVTTEEKYIQAGVVSALQTEEENIENEREQYKRLCLIARNLGDLAIHHTVTHFDLEYLGF